MASMNNDGMHIEESEIREMTHRRTQVILRWRSLFPPHELRSTARRRDGERRTTLEIADVPAISHSNSPVAGPVLAESGMVRSTARIVSWQGRDGRQRNGCGWFSNHPRMLSSTIRQSLIRVLSNSCACLRGRPRRTSLKLKGSAKPATASRNREAVS